MKIWINFEEKDINERKNDWVEGDDFEDQLIFEQEQDSDSCFFEFRGDTVELHFNNGLITMTREEFGDLFK